MVKMGLLLIIWFIYLYSVTNPLSLLLTPLNGKPGDLFLLLGGILY